MTAALSTNRARGADRKAVVARPCDRSAEFVADAKALGLDPAAELRPHTAVDPEDPDPAFVLASRFSDGEQVAAQVDRIANRAPNSGDATRWYRCAPGRPGVERS